MTIKSIHEDRFTERHPNVTFDREIYFGAYHGVILRTKGCRGRRQERTSSFQFTDLYNQQ